MNFDIAYLSWCELGESFAKFPYDRIICKPSMVDIAYLSRWRKTDILPFHLNCRIAPWLMFFFSFAYIYYYITQHHFFPHKRKKHNTIMKSWYPFMHFSWYKHVLICKDIFLIYSIRFGKQPSDVLVYSECVKLMKRKRRQYCWSCKFILM